MKWDPVDQRLYLNTGEEMGGHAGSLSLGNEGELLYGYDGVEWDGRTVPPAIRAEVGQYMAALWKAWAEGQTMEEAHRSAEAADTPEGPCGSHSSGVSTADGGEE